MWLNSKKYHLHIELTSKCNSACPNCPRFIMGSPKLNSDIILSEIKLKDIELWFDKKFIKTLKLWTEELLLKILKPDWV